MESLGAEIPEGTVTVLFSDLVESTQLNQSLGDAAAREIGRRVDEMARRAVADQRGALIKEMGDGLMAAFASTRRAVAAAREMQTEMRRLHRDGLDAAVQMRIGLHTGEVIDEDGDIHGETVIIAKRIEGLAPPGGILASETVHGVLGTARDELVDQGLAELKGIAAEWRLFLVPVPELEEADETLPDNAPTPYVGRVAEREQLRSLVEAAANGHGSTVLIGGPAGLGKSRLTLETAEIARRLGMVVYLGNCLDMSSPPPYQPTIDHFEQAMRTASPEAFRTALGVNAPEISKLLPSLRQRYDDIPPSPELTPEQERRYMLHGVGEFIERAATNQSMVLVFEDLHWADESTLLLFRHVGARAGEIPLLMVGTYRDDELDGQRPLSTAIGPLFRDVGAVDLRPRLLDIDEVTAVLAARAGSDPPRELVDLVYSETQGNPFFVEELFRHLRESGRLFDDEGTWRSGFEIGETEVPQGVRLVIGRRLDQLGPDHRKVLASAAVIGRAFTFELLAAVSSVDEDDIFDALEAAERSNVIEELPADREAGYLFVHEQIRQTLVGELSQARRQRVHVRIADALDASGRSVPAELAHHLVSAGPVAPADRTAAALVAAAVRNIDTLAFEDALHQLGLALDLADPSTGRSIQVMRVEAMRGAGRIEDALGVLDDQLGSVVDGSEEIALRLQRVRLLNDQYRAAEGLDDIAWLVEAAGDDPELNVAVQLARGRAFYIMSLDESGHAEAARDAYAAAYDAASAIDDKVSMARALLPTTWFTDYWPDYSTTAQANVEEALALAEVVGDDDLILDSQATLMHRGGTSWNLDASEELLAHLEQRRDPVKLNAHCFWMMWQYQAYGRFASSVATCDRGIQLADLIGSAPVMYGSIKAINLVEMGRYGEVAGAIAQEVTDDDHPFGQAMASFARSLYLTRICAWGPAAHSLNDTLRRAGEHQRVWMQSWAGSAMAVVEAHCRVGGVTDGPAEFSTFGEWSHGTSGAQIALAEGDPARALELAERLVGPNRAGQARPASRDLVVAHDLVARAHLELGNHAAALDVSTAGLELAEPMEFGSAIWRLRRIRALALGGLGRLDEAATEAALAEAEFETLAQRIAEPDLQDWFRRQPLAPVS